MGILTTILLIYFFTGISLFMYVIIHCDRNIDSDDICMEDVDFIHLVKKTMHRSPLTIIVVMFILGFIWLPLLLTSFSDEDK